MSSSRHNDRGNKGGKRRQDDSGAGSSKSRNSRSRGSYTARAPISGTGTAEDPAIVWFVSRPKRTVGDMYEQMIRDAARVTTLGVWYIRSLSHEHTSMGGANVRDDPHITVFADQHPGEDPAEDFNFEGHLYVDLDENGTPRRLLHPDEMPLAVPKAPVVLYDANQYPYPYYLDDEYYNYYDGSYDEPEAEEDAGEGTSQGKTKRSRKHRKRKGK